MKVFNIDELKKFTSALFVGGVFDNFLITEAEFQTVISVNISGRLSSPSESGDEFAYWRDVKPLAVSIIRGDVLPKAFKIVLRLSNSGAASTSKAVGADSSLGVSYFLNIRFDGKSISLTSGTALSTFSLDKNIEPAWDTLAAKFLNANGLSFSYPES